MQSLLLRVGLDKGTGGGLSPIYKDGTFDLVPIPEEEDTTDDRTYEEMNGRDGRSLADFVSDEHRTSAPHDDPEFETYTYGDPTQKRGQLSRLQEGDLLLFYAGLRPHDYHDDPRLFIVGYFTVDAVHDLEEMSVDERQVVFDRLEINARVLKACGKWLLPPGDVPPASNALIDGFVDSDSRGWRAGVVFGVGLGGMPDVRDWLKN